jgi:hypothetical protein
MALTKIGTYEVMYSANSFVPCMSPKCGNKNLGSSSLSPMERHCRRIT